MLQGTFQVFVRGNRHSEGARHMHAIDARPIAAAVAATWLLLAAVPPGAEAGAPDPTNAADEAAPTTPGLPELLEATGAGIREAMALESQVQARAESSATSWSSGGASHGRRPGRR
jgi:hypothetical protein